MTDFLEMAMADIDDVFFQEFVEQHTIDGRLMWSRMKPD